MGYKKGALLLSAILTLSLFALCSCGAPEEVLDDISEVRQAVEQAGYVNREDFKKEVERIDTGIVPYVMDYDYFYLPQDGKQIIVAIIPELKTADGIEYYPVEVFYDADLHESDVDSHADFSFDTTKSLKVWREIGSNDSWNVVER